MEKTFKNFLEESKQTNPEYGTYIHFCKVLQESGMSREEIEPLFDEHMPKEEYDKKEKGELIDYLVNIAK